MDLVSGFSPDVRGRFSGILSESSNDDPLYHQPLEQQHGGQDAAEVYLVLKNGQSFINIILYLSEI
jgi:hypothetical protein